MLDCEDSVPFRSAVDILDFTDYYQVVHTPMDLGTIDEQFQCGNYDSPKEFAKDVRQVFINSKLYNTNKKSRVIISAFVLSINYSCDLSGVCDDLASVCHV